LAQFGVAGTIVEALPGGQRTAWRAGHLVLKPADSSLDALRWQQRVLGGMVPDGFRIAAPVTAHDGRLAVDGWTAWPALAGAPAPRWEAIVAVGERFHRALAGIPRPSALLDARADRWALADRIAWEPGAGARLAKVPHVAGLLAARRPLGAPEQLVHGDLSGNVLFADGLAPAIIDFSPYWRAPAYASAVVAVDAVAEHGAPPELLTDLAEPQMLVRALLSRILGEADPARSAFAYSRAAEHVLRHTRSSLAPLSETP
jgi:uncharacterized protein (TIGR02569 family)